MKNWFLIFLFGLSLSVVACKSDENKEEETTQTDEYENMKEDVLNEADQMYSDTLNNYSMQMHTDSVK